MFNIQEKYARLIGIPSLGLLLSFVFCKGTVPSFSMYLKTLSFVFVFWQGLYLIINFFRKRFPQIKQTTRRLIFSLAAAISYIVIADFLLRNFYDYFFPNLNWFVDSLALHMLKNFVISFLVAMLYELTYFYGRWNQANLEAERLKTQQIASQLESLKNQISPHFLFNSLNTLAAIIPENQEQAVTFTEKLSEVYRYILQHKDKELIQLNTELDFVHSYLFLLKIRYPENLEINYSISAEEKKLHIAPLTLQILIENAIKHNVISKSKPLIIDVYTDKKGNVIVKNKLQIKKLAKSSTNLGLENIRKRYHFLSTKSVEIINNQKEFVVSIPLIQFQPETN